ncbi:MAG: TlpA disulfide reductase family protein [Pseudomonadota bacterium]
MRLPAKCLWVIASALLALLSTGVQAKPRHPLIGRAAPEVLQHLAPGRPGNFRLSDHRGEVVLLGFWTSWCGSCGDYLEMLQGLDQTYAPAGLVVLGVSLDEDRQAALDFVHPYAAKLRTSNDDPVAVGRLYAVEDVPLTILIDRDGVVRFAHAVNDHINQAAIRRELRTLLDE